ncbi:hypothetical protein DL766_005915 [Monosporascus sp. MC13-8B]|uniref:Uncharacterized protein n=1 Tax=Monosporascus cannonballus TaxID=155416 RepID=A0ABY0H4L9_9PEZI|nr:hypothetical protein DL762_005530 [Monosporascus cannonballus]RYO97870.1 hypothetical protein DL763_002538 [Monosporascus cannonballus]RYP28367.1 hypothetical protein DL766_005915 [Monosporascus sp. MC13-8B]
MWTKHFLAAIQFLLCYIVLGHVALVHAQEASGVAPASQRDVHGNSDVSQRRDDGIVVKIASGLDTRENNVEFDGQDEEVDSDFTALPEKRSRRRKKGGGGGSSSNSTGENGNSGNSTGENGSAGGVAGSAGVMASFAIALSLGVTMGLLGI